MNPITKSAMYGATGTWFLSRKAGFCAPRDTKVKINEKATGFRWPFFLGVAPCSRR
jgi:hypothetical protein